MTRLALLRRRLGLAEPVRPAIVTRPALRMFVPAPAGPQSLMHQEK